MKNKEIAARIREHLKRFEYDPSINVRCDGLGRYWNAGASASGRYVYVQYIAYQGARAISKDDALKYLAWLDAGNIGQHYKSLEAK